MTVAIPLWTILAAMGVVIVWLALWVHDARAEVGHLKRRMRTRLQDLLAEPQRAVEMARHWQKHDDGSVWVPPQPPPPPPRNDDDSWRRTWKSSTGPDAPREPSKAPPRPNTRPAAKKGKRA